MPFDRSSRWKIKKEKKGKKLKLQKDTCRYIATLEKTPCRIFIDKKTVVTWLLKATVAYRLGTDYRKNPSKGVLV